MWWIVVCIKGFLFCWHFIVLLGLISWLIALFYDYCSPVDWDGWDIPITTSPPIASGISHDRHYSIMCWKMHLSAPGCMPKCMLPVGCPMVDCCVWVEILPCIHHWPLGRFPLQEFLKELPTLHHGLIVIVLFLLHRPTVCLPRGLQIEPATIVFGTR